MAKITINPIAGDYASVGAINARLSQIEAEFNDKVLYRDNPIGEPNEQSNDIDLNGNNLLNAGNPAFGATDLDGLTDVDISTTPPTDGQTIVWDEGQMLFIPGDAGGGSGVGGGTWSIIRTDHDTQPTWPDPVNDQNYWVYDLSGGDVTVTLPDASLAAGKHVMFIIKQVGTGDTLTLDSVVTYKGNGQDNHVVQGVGAFIHCVSDGLSWAVINAMPDKPKTNVYTETQQLTLSDQFVVADCFDGNCLFTLPDLSGDSQDGHEIVVQMYVEPGTLTVDDGNGFGTIYDPLTTSYVTSVSTTSLGATFTFRSVLGEWLLTRHA